MWLMAELGPMPRPSKIQIQVASSHFLSSAPSWCPSPCFIGPGANVELLPIWIPQQDRTAPNFSMDCPIPLPPPARTSWQCHRRNSSAEGPPEDRVTKGSGIYLKTMPPSKLNSFQDNATLHLKHHCHLFTEEASWFFYLRWACVADVTDPKEQVELISWSFSPPTALIPLFLVSHLPRWCISFSTNGSSACWGSESSLWPLKCLLPCPYP